MNDRQLSSLLKIIECGSFSRAEEALYISKQALKKQIDSLEEELGFALIVRSRQGIALTPAGKEFCRETRRLLAEMNSITRKCKEIAFNEKTIRIENPFHPKLMLEKAFDEFSRRFPTVKQHIILQTSDRLVDDILNDHADLAECTYHPKFECPGISCTKLFPSPYKCLFSSSHPLAVKSKIQLKDLAGHQVYMLRSNTSLVTELTENYRDLNLNFVVKNDMPEITNICYNNGIFISRAYYLSFMQPLIAIPLDTDIIPVAAVLHRDNPPEVVKEFIRVIQEVYPSIK
ncbi:MAG: LysR family transcriptional regulator [Lachnospiraceae bacterium]